MGFAVAIRAQHDHIAPNVFPTGNYAMHFVGLALIAAELARARPQKAFQCGSFPRPMATASISFIVRLAQASRGHLARAAFNTAYRLHLLPNKCILASPTTFCSRPTRVATINAFTERAVGMQQHSPVHLAVTFGTMGPIATWHRAKSLGQGLAINDSAGSATAVRARNRRSAINTSQASKLAALLRIVLDTETLCRVFGGSPWHRAKPGRGLFALFHVAGAAEFGLGVRNRMTALTETFHITPPGKNLSIAQQECQEGVCTKEKYIGWNPNRHTKRLPYTRVVVERNAGCS